MCGCGGAQAPSTVHTSHTRPRDRFSRNETEPCEPTPNKDILIFFPLKEYPAPFGGIQPSGTVLAVSSVGGALLAVLRVGGTFLAVLRVGGVYLAVDGKIRNVAVIYSAELQYGGYFADGKRYFILRR